MRESTEYVKSLPEVVQDALRRVGYTSREVHVYVRETASRQCLGGEGRKGFCVIGNLATLEISPVSEGSWGGANAFNPSNAVDMDSASYTLPPDAFVVNGSTGYKGTYATVTIGFSNASLLLPAADVAPVTPREVRILGTCGLLSAYKKRGLADMNVTDAEIDSLVTRGYLARNKAGATSRTPAGCNASARNI